ncbi:MORC family CW-type zinc finger protein 3, partial [Ophiophagus hannah]
MAAVQNQSGILLSALCPKFLHTNSTSHTWPFSAVAELIDNAYDPDVNAKQMWIDKTIINENVCLTFMDNGNGMNADKLHKMLSFGFSDKVTLSGHIPVGLYGNGFKSGSMRLGKDAIVFTKNGDVMSVGIEKNEQTEFDFNTDKYDIRIPADLDEVTGKRGYKKQERQDQIVPESDYSLRAYCSILYLKPRMQIIIRGQKVQTQLVSKSLAHIERDVYKPKFLAPKTVRITFGFNCRNKDHYGMMMYHRNRLIKAYERANNMGVGVIGIIECNFLKPTHNKQDFDYTNEYRRTIHALGEKLNDYWNEMQAKKTEYPLEVLVEDIQKRPDQTWVQCDICLKWRKLPDGIDHLPEKWFCSYNPDPQFRNCNVPEEPEDDDLIPYEKTHKKKDREKLKKRLEYSQQIYNEMYLQTTSVLSNTSPAMDESISRLHVETSNIPLNMPLNVSDSSVSSPHSDSEKRLKRKRSNSDLPLQIKITRVTSQAFENKKNVNEDDNDVIILEENSTPKPATEECDIKIVKVEGGANLDYIGDDGEDSKSKDACSEVEHTKGTAATQTEWLAVKKEEEDASVEKNQLSRPEPELTISEPAGISKSTLGDVDSKINELNIQLQLAQNEKEKYEEQYKVLFKKVKILEQKIVEMKDKHMKKEMCHQSTETNSTLSDDELEKIKGKSPEEILIFYEQALNEIKWLKKQCTTLQNLKSECTKCRNSESKTEVDEMAVQLDDVFRQLDKCSIERDQYKNEIEVLEMEKNQLHTQHEELKAEIVQLKAAAPQMLARTNDSVASNHEEPVNYSDGESLKLRSLRVNVGLLLATIMPDLDLKQVDYDVDVVDEILGQVVEHMNEISSA